MTRHTHVHTGTRPHTCTFPGCGKQFIQTSALTVHSRVHTGEKPHVCPEDGCEKRFSDVGHSLIRLNSHPELALTVMAVLQPRATPQDPQEAVPVWFRTMPQRVGQHIRACPECSVALTSTAGL